MQGSKGGDCPSREQETSESGGPDPLESISRKTFLRTLRDFSETTTLHGVNYLGQGSVVRRLLWTLAIFASFGLCARQIIDSVTLYLKWPISTSFTTEIVSELGFPAITICNFNSLSKKQFEKINSRPNASVEEIKVLRERVSQLVGIFSGHTTNLSMSGFSEKMLTQRGFLSADYIAKTSHQIEDILSLEWPPTCTFSGRNCGPRNFTPIFTERFGQCYTFNSGKEGHEELKARMVGANNGLRLKLFVDQESYVTNFLDPQAGFKVLIHSQQEYPFVEELGFAIQPGTHTFCAIRRKEVCTFKSFSFLMYCLISLPGTLVCLHALYIYMYILIYFQVVFDSLLCPVAV